MAPGYSHTGETTFLFYSFFHPNLEPADLTLSENYGLQTRSVRRCLQSLIIAGKLSLRTTPTSLLLRSVLRPGEPIDCLPTLKYQTTFQWYWRRSRSSCWKILRNWGHHGRDFKFFTFGPFLTMLVLPIGYRPSSYHWRTWSTRPRLSSRLHG